MMLFNHFIAGLIISFVGTLPPGMISLTVINTTVKKSVRQGILVAAGASFLEFFQAFAAVFFSRFLTHSEVIKTIINYSAAPVFAGLGLFFLFRKVKHTSPEKAYASSSSSFLKGMLISSFNLFVIPFWIFWSTYLANKNWIELQLLPSLVLTIGIITGTFLALLLYIWMGRLLKNKVDRIGLWIDNVVGMAFLAFAVYHTIRLAAEVLS
ncbi:MAG: hypothetical protein KatS3mg031_0046 [Chitinophagales bacterium]|nr:MAG: hypothetical protein KatS3mg031_0046 [Chitinophagales bacterium]